ncbi:putative Zinc metalloproteinase nas-14 [Hypsibius exemplaris]|uniref:Metalloendopeptidase n=1 Tax=Hypsibius exemplaris TaxID=2072580 RepID=A0A9X6NHC1_HYPEX|nr:putative Zinc metalloproteinase nas-14 [Hypsibius exemplaris]
MDKSVVWIVAVWMAVPIVMVATLETGEQHKSLFEGDILGVDVDVDEASFQANLAHNAETDSRKLWPNGQVPVVFNGGAFTSSQQAMINQAMRDISQKTCITFVQRSRERDYLLFRNDNDGCSSYVGRNGDGQPQVVQLANDCFDAIGVSQHEIMHALGFHHEQTRMDRDDYVQILKNNISPDNFRVNFAKYNGNTQRLPYDYNSIMHYGYNYFAVRRGSPTIRVKKQGAKIGNRAVMSPMDVQRINMLYNCQNRGTGGPAPSRGKKPSRRRPQQRRRLEPNWFSDASSFFSQVNGDEESPLGDQPSSGMMNDGGSRPRSCPADSPNKMRNDFCQSDDDCLDSGLGEQCCPNCVGTTCNAFCN